MPGHLFPKKKKTYKKYARYALNGVSVTGMVIFTGFMSFTGALILDASIYAAIAAFFFGGVIEGEVYAHNLSRSLLKIFNSEYLKDFLIVKKLAEFKKR